MTTDAPEATTLPFKAEVQQVLQETRAGVERIAIVTWSLPYVELWVFSPLRGLVN